MSFNTIKVQPHHNLLYIEFLSRYMFRGYTPTIIRIVFLCKSHDDPDTGSKHVAS